MSPKWKNDLTLTTSSGKLASSATCIPKLWSQIPWSLSEKKNLQKESFTIPGSTLYKSVISRSLLFSTCATTCKFFTCEICWSSAVSSWKWVAKRQKACICEAMCLQKKLWVDWKRWQVMFYLSLWYRPGKTKTIIRWSSWLRWGEGEQVYQEMDSPRPNSSMMMRESLVADWWQGIKQI